MILSFPPWLTSCAGEDVHFLHIKPDSSSKIRAVIYVILGSSMTCRAKIKKHLSLNICNGLIFSMSEGKIVVFQNVEFDNKYG